MPSFQELADALIPEVNGKRNYPNRTPHRKPATHKVPEAKDILLVYSKLGSLRNVGRTRTDVLFSNKGSISDVDFRILVDKPLLAAFGIQSGLCCGEGLRVDQDQRLLRV
jgi:hypothetical protein